jgi:hypothetical protein
MNETETTETGELARVNSQGELVPIPEEDVFGEVIKRDLGSTKTQVKASYDTTTAEGKTTLMRHVSSDPKQDDKLQFFGSDFLLVAYTGRVVKVTRNQDGTRMAEPKLLIKIIMEAQDGTMISSSSSYVWNDLEMIKSANPDMGFDRPVAVRFRKGGAADRVYSPAMAAPRKPAQVADHGTKKTK